MNISNSEAVRNAEAEGLLKREAENRGEWVEIQTGICRVFAEERESRKADQDFGDWVGARCHNAGTPKMDRNTSGAYVAMGAHLEFARDVLMKTKRSSIRTIYEHEFKPRLTGGTKAPRRKNPPEVKKEQRAVNLPPEVWDEFKEKVEGEGVSVANKLGDMVKRYVDPELPPAETVLGKTAVEKLEAYKRHFERDFAVRVEVEARRRNAEWVEESMQRWHERLAKLEKQLEWRKGVFTSAEFRLLQRCCHPDTGPHVSDEKRNEATRLLKDNQLRLMSEKEDPMVGHHGLPRTRAEMEAARAEVRAANSARAKAAHAARKAKATVQ